MASITNNTDFLQSIFGDQWGNAHVCQFPQPPDSPQGGNWKGMSASQANGQLDQSEWNQFYTVSLFNPAADGSSRRTKDLFLAQYALVLDDLGTGPGAKIPMSVLDGKPLPQYAIETSKDNYQIVYIFEQPVTNADLLARVIDALIEQGLSADADPGFKGVTRYVRLPYAVNNKIKYGYDFHCQITEVDPTGRVTIPQLVEGWGLTVKPPGKGLAVVSTPGEVEQSLSYKLLTEHNLWTGEQGAGWWGTPCPQQELHTVDDGRTALNVVTGEFKCMHGSCEGLNRGDLEGWLMHKYPGEAVGLVFGEPVGTAAPGVDDFTRRARMLSSDQGAQANALIFEASKVLSNVDMSALMGECAGFLKSDLKADLKKAQKASRGMGGRVVASGAVAGELAERYLYVQEAGKYFNMNSKTVCTGTAFDIAYMEPNGEGGPGIAAQIRFKEQGGQTVKSVRWLPWPYFGEPEYIINAGTDFSAANMYQPPPAIKAHQDDNRVLLWMSLFKHLIPSEHEREVYMDHMAFTLQHPEQKIQWQMLHIGQKRIGKDAILYPLIQFLGRNASEIDLDDESAKWGDTKSGRKALVFSEVFRPQDKGFENQLKTMAASTASGKGWVNMKGGQLVEQENLFSIYAMSNYENCMHLDPDDARWFAISSLDAEKLHPAEYDLFWYWMKQGTGVYDVAGWLLGRDVSKFSVGKMPWHTQAYMDISAASMSNLASMLAGAKEQELGPFSMDLFTLDDVLGYLRNSGWKDRVNRVILGNELKLIGCYKLKKRTQKLINGKRLRSLTLYANLHTPSLEAMSGTELHDAYISVQAGVKFASTGDIDSGGDV